MKKSYVYFVQAPGRIKIGFTMHPSERLVALQSQDMEPLTMIAIIEGSRALERHLHKMLVEFNHRREWFRDCPEVRAVIQSAVAGEISVAEPKPAEDLPSKVASFEFRILPILEARALTMRLYLELMEELVPEIRRRRAAGLPVDELVAIGKRTDPHKFYTPPGSDDVLN